MRCCGPAAPDGGRGVAVVLAVFLMLAFPVTPALSSDPLVSSPGRSSQRVTQEGSAVIFTEVGAESGVDFVHTKGASGSRYMAETMGAGTALLDYDVDGRLDLYLVESGPLPGFEPAAGDELVNELYRSVGGSGSGDWRFADATQSAGDYDNDGFLDLYVTNFGTDVLYRGNGDGTFTEVTGSAGVGTTRWSVSAAFGDVDADGDLDLYVVRYVDFALDNHKRCLDPATGLQDYCHPDVYDGEPDVLYGNRGDGTFAEITEEAGVAPADGKGLGVTMADYDADGDLDIYVANDSTRNFLFRNGGGGRFEEVGLLTGVAFNEEGTAEAGMGVHFGDYDGDELLDIFVTNLDMETNTLYRNLGGQLFVDTTFAAGMGVPSYGHVGFGTGFLDYDNDADLDVLIANGHILESVDLRGSNITFKQRNFLMRNDGGRFVDASDQSGEYFRERESSRGLALGDVDNDGDLDAVITNSGAEPDLLRNDGGSARPALTVSLVGVEGNRHGVGARLRLGAGGRVQVREVSGGYSYAGHNDLRAFFGLDTAGEVERLEIRWPGGATEVLDDLPADRWIVVRQGRGVVASRPLEGSVR